MSNPRRISLACIILLAICATTVVVGLGTAGAAGGEPSEDHLVVSDIPSVSTAQAVTLERFSGTGVSDGASWTLPTTASGSNKPFTLQGSSTAVGALALSQNGRFLSLAGYTTAVGGNAEAAEARDVARVNAAGEADTSTTLGLSFQKEKIRGAVSKDGNQFWVTGNGNGTGNTPLGGMVYAPIGHSGAPTVIFSKEVPATSSNKALNNMRTVQIAGGNLWTGSEKGTAGIYEVEGLPTTGKAPTIPITLHELEEEEDPISQLPLESTPGSGTVDTIYVVRENGSGEKKHAVGAILKYAHEGASWVLKGTVATGKFTAITGKVDSEGHFRLYAIAEVEEAAVLHTAVEMITDSAAFNAAPSASAPVTVATAPAGTSFRGIAFAPQAATTGTPGEPTAVTGTAGNGKVTLSWTAPGAAGGSPITGYVITPYIAGVAQTPIATGSTATSKVVEGLADGTAYTFRVAAANASGSGANSLATGALTPEVGAGPVPTIVLGAEHLEATNGDPTNPTDTVTVAQEGVPASALTVEATASSNPGVAAVSDVTIDGSGATRTVSVTPAGAVGYADITLKVSGEEGKTATVVLHYAASAAAPSPANARFFTGAADASTAIAVGGGYVLLGDDENNTIRLYKDDVSGAPVKTWNFDAQMGNPEEIDIEAAARAGSTIYWTGSMGNSKSGNLKPDRSTLFTTQITGSGASTELSFGGYYKGLRQDLIAWDEAHANRFGFAAGSASGQIAKEINGFNVEGLEFAPGSTSTAYIGFRAPLSPAAANGKAIVVPVTNIDQLAASGHNTTTHATFAEPILMDLGGLSVREIRKNAFDEYLIIAGSYAGGGEFALYTWDGVAGDAPVRALTALPGETGSGEDPGSWESIVEVPHPVAGGESVQLVMDNGSTDFYGDGAEAKTLPAEWEKDRTETFTLDLPAAPVATEPPSVTGAGLVGSTLTCHPGTWTGNPTPTFTYEWTSAGVAIGGATEATYTTVAADAGHRIGCVVTAANTAGAVSEASSNTILAGTAPANTSPPMVFGQAPVGSMLSCAGGSWTGNPPPTFTYEWLREGAVIDGVTQDTYVTVAGDAGKAIGCRVTATNAVASVPATSSNTITPATTPANSVAPTVTGPAAVGSTLTCEPGTWTGTPAPTFTYEWLREDAAIAGATGSTYVTGDADIGELITCKVTGTNGGGSATVTSSNGVVPASSPVNTTAPTVSGVSPVGATLTCEPGGWSGTPAPTFTYEWLREGSTISGATASTYVTVSGDVGKQIGCRVTATNGGGQSSAASSNTIVPATAPVNTTAPTVSGQEGAGSTLTCDPGTWTGTPAPTFTYEWLREGSTISGATAPSYVTVSDDIGKQIGCRVTGENGAATVRATSSNTITPNTAPADTVAPGITGATVVGSLLTCSPGTWNGTPAPTFTYQWLRDGVAIEGATASTYTSVAADAGKALSCKVTATNSAGSASATSNTIAVVEAAKPNTGGDSGNGSGGNSGGGSPAGGGSGGGGAPSNGGGTASVTTPHGPVTVKGDRATVGELSCGSSSCTVTDTSATLKIGGKATEVKVKLRGKISADGSVPVKIVLPKALREELAGKTAIVRVKVKLRNAAGVVVTKTIAVKIKAKAAH